ncbi:hypothetical protein DFJ63DRAFT_237825 [Scheffersomyces coipomensis]|uniref:uncharacterized protein n=1 Tax=Scheffersomyces coipomensis TaxID=1788519 RepID=UPI00315D0B26
MIANSTAISNRLFRSSKFLIFIILAFFIVILMITAFAGKGGSQEMISKAMDYYSSAGTTLGNSLLNDKTDAEVEQNTEPEDKDLLEIQKQKQKQFDQKQKQNEDKAADLRKVKGGVSTAESKVDELDAGADVDSDVEDSNIKNDEVAGLI